MSEWSDSDEEHDVGYWHDRYVQEHWKVQELRAQLEALRTTDNEKEPKQGTNE